MIVNVKEMKRIQDEMERVEYQKGILPNLLSGFYEQVMKEKKDLSLLIIFKELRKEFEQQRKQGAVDFANEVLLDIEAQESLNRTMGFANLNMAFNPIKEFIEERLKE